MRITRNGSKILAIVAGSLLAIVGASSCGDSQSATNSDDNSTATPGNVTHVPPELAEILQRDDIVVDDGTFDGGMSPEESLTAFAKEYDPSVYEEAPTVYAVEMASSQESRLPAGLPARMIHVPGVEQDITGPAPPPGETEATPMIIETDLFAFLDAESGQLLAAVYIGPPQ